MTDKDNWLLFLAKFSMLTDQVNISEHSIPEHKIIISPQEDHDKVKGNELCSLHINFDENEEFKYIELIEG
jgi:hypothetical protein